MIQDVKVTTAHDRYLSEISILSHGRYSSVIIYTYLDWSRPQVAIITLTRVDYTSLLDVIAGPDGG